MKENILITGGAGYLGSILSEDLVRLNYNVTVVDNFLYKQASLNHLTAFQNFNVVNADVRDINKLKTEMKVADIIIPLAALVGAPICKADPVGSETINKNSVIDLLNIKSKDQKIIMPTTNSAYGSGGYNNFCDETSPLNPISRYAKDKVLVEENLLEKDNTVSLRLATVFGMSPRMRLDLLVNDFVYKAINEKVIVLFEGHFKRNYIHVRDVSRAFMHCMSNFDTMKSEIFNVGLSSANLSKLELCQEIKKIIPNLNIIELETEKDPDQRNYIVSNEKIEQSGYQPKWSIEDGIVELVKGFKMIKNRVYGNI